MGVFGPKRDKLGLSANTRIRNIAGDKQRSGASGSYYFIRDLATSQIF